MTTECERDTPSVSERGGAKSTTETVEARRQRWLEENREAIADYNRWVAENGLILEKYHLF